MMDSVNDKTKQATTHAGNFVSRLIQKIRSRKTLDEFAPADYLYRLAETILLYKAANLKEPSSPSVRSKEFLEVYLECPQEDGIQELARFLSVRPKLQERISFLVDYTPSRWLVEQEIPELEVRRGNPRPNPVTYKDDPYKWMYDHEIKGVCFSGGGIRSATLNLGILQGLASLKTASGNASRLESIDYLSSVSGGGYIHEWLAAWIKREKNLKSVVEQLVPLPELGCLPFHAAPLRWLRRYSNYLTPKTGFFTADTWVVAAIWLRNTFLNQLILVSALLLLVMFPHLLVHGAGVGGSTQPLWLVHLLALSRCSQVLWSFSLLFFLAAVAITTISLDRAKEYGQAPCVKTRDHLSPGGSNATANQIVGLTLLSALLMARLVITNPKTPPESIHLYVGVFLAILFANILVVFAGGADQAFDELETSGPNPPEIWKVAWRWFKKYVVLLGLFPATAAGAATALFAHVQWLLLTAIPGWIALVKPPLNDFSHWDIGLILGTPLFLAVPFFSQVILAGLIGIAFEDWLREWLARVRAWSLMFGVGWGGWFAIALLSRPLIDHTWKAGYTQPIHWAALGTWLATTLGGVLSGKSPQTNGATPATTTTSKALNILALVAPYVFVAGLLVLLAWAGDYLLSVSHGMITVCLFVALGLVFGLFGWRVNINEFSMNPFYRNRLTRCCLGATNRLRRPNPLTGFDECDAKDTVLSSFGAGSYQGPFPIFCTTLNLTFGEDLAWQERKAASFAFTPFLSGYHVGWTSGGEGVHYNGYVPTKPFAYPGGGINVASAVAISGAAVSPNWGYHTNPATAFLLTMFNVRLGWWLRNPRKSKFAGLAPTSSQMYDPAETAAPRFSALQLTQELLGSVGDQTEFVYLSDGGHFENMGLYELVRRRCRYIVICDAEEDHTFSFSGIGNAIQRCRVDFGVEVNLNLLPLRPQMDPQLGYPVCQQHFVEGTIHYPERASDNPPAICRVLYIKGSLTGQNPKFGLKKGLPFEPGDIINHRLENDAFPNDTTLNQWFDEQTFESYRKLGIHIAEEIERCGGWAKILF